MTSRVAARLVLLYPRGWRIRYGQEFAALLEQHPLSFKTFANVLWSAGEAHMRAKASQQCGPGAIVGSVWSAWIVAMLAGLILYGMVDDSAMPAAMNQSVMLAAGWMLIQAGSVLAVSSIVIAGLPLAWSIGFSAVRQRRRGDSLRLATPFLSAFVLVSWMAAVLMCTGGHWAASPWALAFAGPDCPSESFRWITGSISAVLLVLGCLASAISISHLLRGAPSAELRIALRGVDVRINPLSFAAALAPGAAAGIVLMLAGVVVWGCIAHRLSAVVFRSLSGPLGLSGVASWILCMIILGFAAAISARAAWRGRRTAADY